MRFVPADPAHRLAALGHEAWELHTWGLRYARRERVVVFDRRRDGKLRERAPESADGGRCRAAGRANASRSSERRERRVLDRDQRERVAPRAVGDEGQEIDDLRAS